MRNKKYLKTTMIFIFGIIALFPKESFSQNKLPDADIKLNDGSILERKSLINNFVIVNLWGTWCKPCIAEIPELNNLVSEFKNKEVIFLALATDESVKLNTFLQIREFNFVHLDKSNSKYFDLAKIKSYPKTLVYSKTGELIKKYTGQITEKNIEELKNVIQ